MAVREAFFVRSETGRSGKERLAVGLISTAHFCSHFYQLALIPLFPLMHATFGVSYIELGLIMTSWNVAGILAQTPIGFLVDRFGSRRLLIGALLLQSVALLSMAMWPAYGWLVFAFGIAGIANATYHPADYDILNNVVAPERVGRAFAAHTFAGNLGFGAAPPVMIGLATAYGLPVALFAAAALGAIVAIPLFLARGLEHVPGVAKTAVREQAKLDIRSLLTPSILGLTLFFTLINLAGSGLSNFSIVALHALWAVPLGLAGAALTAMLFCTALGVLVGGMLADKTARHENIATAGFAFNACLIAIVGTFNLTPYGFIALLAVAGFCSGMIYPSRDMLVRKAAPAGAMGRTFGIVTTGFNIGGTIGPLIFGALLDHGEPRLIFYLTTVFMLLTAALPVLTERRKRGAALRASAAA